MNTLAIGGSAPNLQLSAATKRPAEGSRAEEAKESQMTKTAEQLKAAVSGNPPTAPSPEGIGKTVNLKG